MARIKKSVHPYSEEDKLLIAQMPNEASAIREMAIRLNRSAAAIKLKKWQMEHKAHRQATQQAFIKEYRTRITDIKNSNQRWSKEEEDMVLHSSLSDFQLATQLKRTLASVSAKRHRLLTERGKNGRKK